MMTEIVETAGQDTEAVAAVRNGDAERYRELVERHERRVFAVAWSRLGDATLAEEATQEAFIRGYRRLWLLGDGAKFSGWIASIARNSAINLGLRHRRELNKRERWALENTDFSTNDDLDTEADSLHTPETLRQTLATLPTAHRECLVLFYIEGKSGAEAAEALGISETALRVRLHRARAAMREQLEDKLESSLAKLRPTKTLVPAIMASILASTSAKAATAGGMGATILGTLTKFVPLKWAFGLFPFVFALPTLLFSWLMYRAEMANYRDAKGFRVQLIRSGMIRQMIMVGGIFALVFFFLRHRKLQFENFYLCLAAFSIITTLIKWRQLVINRSRYLSFITLASLIIIIACLLIGLSIVPIWSLNLFIVVQMILMMSVNGERPIRMDYNLFLRASENMLDLPAVGTIPTKSGIRFNQAELLAFGRFLGSRWMADSYSWTAKGLLLRLPPFKFTYWNAFLFFGPWSWRSQLLLSWQGDAFARLCENDKKTLHDLHPQTTTQADELEDQVAIAVEAAWEEFRAGNFARAERILGQLPEAELFHKPPAKVGYSRWRKGSVIALVVLTAISFGLKWYHPPALNGLKPVSVTESQVRTFLGSITTNRNPIINNQQRTYPGDPSIALFSCLVLPSTNLFSPEGLRGMRDSVAGDESFTRLKTGEGARAIYDDPLPRHAFSGGWISWSDLETSPEKMAALLRANRFPRYQFKNWDYVLTQVSAWSWVKQERHLVMRMQAFGLAQLQLLQKVNCLDLVDRERLIKEIASVQTLSGEPPGQPTIHHWEDIRGLFFTPCSAALQDTYFALAGLEILGGLDKINREACIEGILKRHRGKGYFVSPDPGGYNEYHIDGSTRDTIAAFESLRILNALERVDDLEKWQFRVHSRDRSKPDANGIRTPTWSEVEAWVCQQRLETILRERKEHPQAAIRSLMEQ